MVFFGTTPGAVPNESVELGNGFGFTDVLDLEDGKTYILTVSVTAGGVVAGPLRVNQAFILSACARQDAGVVTVSGTNTLDKFGDGPPASTWTFAITAGAAPARVVMTFTTGATPANTTVVARVEMTEITYP